MERVAALALGVALASCEPCTRDCSQYQTVIFVDGSGAPLTPLALTDGNIVHRCSDTRTVACEGNELTYVITDYAPHSIRAEATTGEVFEGELAPMKIAHRPTGSCGCGLTLDPISVPLSTP